MKYSKRDKKRCKISERNRANKEERKAKRVRLFTETTVIYEEETEEMSLSASGAEGNVVVSEI